MPIIEQQHASSSDTDRTHNLKVSTWYDKISKQKVAASLAADMAGQCEFRGQVIDVYANVQAAPAAGESMSIDVLLNNVSIFSSVPILDNSNVWDYTTHISLWKFVDQTKITGVSGTLVTVTRVYTAGGGPTPMGATSVHVNYARQPVQ